MLPLHSVGWLYECRWACTVEGRTLKRACTHPVLKCLGSAAQASIDQVDGLLTFEQGSQQLLQWDERIHSVCAALNGVIDSAAARQATTAAA